MLYVTTRSDTDTYTVQRALRENRGPDGGLFRPFRAPCFSPAEVQDLMDLPFGECLAQVLNLLFRARLTGREVLDCVGDDPVRVRLLPRRVAVAEAWHNPAGDHARTAAELSALLRGGEAGLPGDWVRIAVGIAVLFGVFGQLRRDGVEGAVDVSVVSGDFSAPMSAWYARHWGLPVGSIICCCNENAGLWELICHGQMRTDALSIPTLVPEADVALPEDLERLVRECGGTAEVARYLDVCRRGGVYAPPDAVRARLREGLYVSVVSSQRLGTTIPSVLRTHQCVLAPGGALAYAGLLDYRAKRGQTRWGLVLAEKSPLRAADTVAQALGLTPEQLRKIV